MAGEIPVARVRLVFIDAVKPAFQCLDQLRPQATGGLPRRAVQAAQLGTVSLEAEVEEGDDAGVFRCDEHISGPRCGDLDQPGERLSGTGLSYHGINYASIYHPR